ncbi:unnamed protein product [Rhodiola kirilowii]
MSVTFERVDNANRFETEIALICRIISCSPTLGYLRINVSPSIEGSDSAMLEISRAMRQFVQASSNTDIRNLIMDVGEKKVKSEAGDEVDRISALPVHLRESILECVPLKDAMRTSVLARKWRHCWTGIRILDFDETEHENAELFHRAVDRVLLLHSGPIIKFDLIIPANGKHRKFNVSDWFHVLSKNGIQDIWFDAYNVENRDFWLPSTLFQCRDLKILVLHYCTLTVPPDFKGFYHLVDLEISFCKLPSHILGSLISQCPLLENLALDSTCKEYIEQPLIINALNLRTLCYENYLLGTINFKNVPMLTDVSLLASDVYDIEEYERLCISWGVICSLSLIKELLFDIRLLGPVSNNLPRCLPTIFQNLKTLTLRSVNAYVEDDMRLEGFFHLSLLVQLVSNDIRVVLEPEKSLEAALRLLETETKEHCTLSNLVTVVVHWIGDGLDHGIMLVKILQSRCPNLKSLKVIPDRSWTSDQNWQKRKSQIEQEIAEKLNHGYYDESEESNNQGNFMELIKYTANKVVFKKAHGNNQMISPMIQKDIVSCFSQEVICRIIEEIDNDVFALLVDECSDVSYKEQMAVILRFVDKSGTVKERFIGVIHVKDTSSANLKNAIDSLFSEHGLSLKSVRGQGYDGASNMKGISALPIHIRESILECLPIKTAMRTSVLARKWRYCWTGMRYLDFDDTERENAKMLHRAVERVLLIHSGPISSFYLRVINALNLRELYYVDDLWGAIIFNNVPRLVFAELTTFDKDGMDFERPCSAWGLICSLSLIKELVFDISLLGPVIINVPRCLPTMFQNLKTLTLRSVDACVDDHMRFVLCLIRSSPGLQDLTIYLELDCMQIRFWPESEKSQEAKEDCKLSNLKTVVLYWFGGSSHEIMLVKILLSRCPNLVSFKVTPDDKRTADDVRMQLSSQFEKCPYKDKLTYCHRFSL